MLDTKRGKFIVLEGTDGSGKTEQFNRLVLRLPAECRVQAVDFPRYAEPSSHFITKYLKGRYGGIEDVGPRAASMFYALDRFDASFKMREWLHEGRIVVGNRYMGSNLGHQGAKIADDREREALFRWLYELEYEILKIPKPDLNIILYVPAEIAYELIAKKSAREYLKGAKRDIHEANLEHLKAAARSYAHAAKLFPSDFVVVECAPNGKLLLIEEVHEKVWAVAQKALEM
ncbi:MAG: hypothetical protein A2945_03805 [Candidatus Liptonbacteria bacterium RIFCSPLOWO2_01_FULL_52_25]|uniref:Thymidylate kinase n=1 Tax=Candidatus Liptonbacteria bacterium RIFCSPLOWO2_01_FULL_52_25 TaxID=1798650 RepID=A0A1G2CGB8_9BACT|nr:MAG: hypothetical protein A2945_03805 [Candidatus Liptonbacteria bacterium RIFCSPLOWO2_01_FULL_52_25]